MLTEIFQNFNLKLKKKMKKKKSNAFTESFISISPIIKKGIENQSKDLYYFPILVDIFSKNMFK